MELLRLRDRQAYRLLIRASGLTYRELAAKVGCHPSYVHHLARGRREHVSPEMGKRIALALGVSLDSLFTPKMSTPNDRQTEGVA